MYGVTTFFFSCWIFWLILDFLILIWFPPRLGWEVSRGFLNFLGMWKSFLYCKHSCTSQCGIISKFCAWFCPQPTIIDVLCRFCPPSLANIRPQLQYSHSHSHLNFLISWKSLKSLKSLISFKSLISLKFLISLVGRQIPWEGLLGLTTQTQR